jgi:HAD superfamily hydrolase (TIGR01509 family)
LKLDAVIFDMDGLMFDTEALNLRAWQEAGRLHGFDIPDEVIHMHIGATVDVSRRIMLEHFGPGFDFDVIRADRLAIARREIEEKGTPVKRGLLELLAFLKERHIKTAVASSTEERYVRFYIDRAEIKHVFDALICGDKVKRSKPAPDIFLAALDILGVAAGSAMVLEDSYNGVRAAAAAGIRVVMVPDLLPATPEMEELCLQIADSLLAIPSLCSLA